jgi:hypothetical protein
MTKCQNSQRNDPFCGPKTHVPEELAVRTIAPLVARDSVASGSIGYERVIDAFASNLDFRDANALCTGGAGYERAFEATSVLQADSVLPPACGVDEVREKGACARGGWHKGRHKGLCLQLCISPRNLGRRLRPGADCSQIGLAGYKWFSLSLGTVISVNWQPNRSHL